MAEQRKIRVAVVFGGRSSEHEISCVTAGSVLSVIDADRYEVVPVGITRDGDWVLASGDPRRLAITDGRLPEVAGDGASLALPFSGGSGFLVVSPERVPQAIGEVDVVLPLLHGPFGEDGTLQGLLEMMGARYAGSGVFASAASMDKVFMKVLLAGQGIKVGPYVAVSDREWRRERKRILDDVAELGGVVFVKPARAGSSIGISRVPDAADAEAVTAAIEAARAHDPKVIVEAGISGREIECGVLESLDGGAPDVSLPAEIHVAEGFDFYDFEAKYLSSSRLTIPAELPTEVTERIRGLAAASFEAMGCEGLARVDFFYGDDGEVYVNEINTLPGFTPASAFPQMWAASGLDYPALVDRLIQTALRRSPGLR
ncbi:D-alanine--D-alanine ligase family protein [Marinitenerispora sediminis]|uniref:D-alanine--D-alanine ligase n=1 Tax=Marinitenerispora sediminis TaxID=1931232 RepID=A0A368TBD0_9ACTN|nr:D-alanine--D-alanine ligase family protein [Marinitenerispora sediminis]RCV54027.1 D-alanine--D-alanine ligase A [Marinitenerispora sediminis]RCV60822.1 D-alanine--D-alanine ligase A [Marinitenerispora sediminis]RCV62453.1 D-alanine--D-alanine ligase A [Marinitenerispora sediminis]